MWTYGRQIRSSHIASIDCSHLISSFSKQGLEISLLCFIFVQHRFIFLRVCPSLLQSRATCNANSACCANKRASLQVYCIHTAYRVQYLASHSPPNPNPNPNPTDTKALALRIRHGCGRTTTALLPPIQKRVALKHRNLNRDTHMRVKRVRSMQLPVCTCVILFSWDGLA